MPPDPAFACSHSYESATAEGAGERERGSPAFVCLMAPVRVAEVHWFEAHGIGRQKMRIKGFLD